MITFIYVSVRRRPKGFTLSLECLALKQSQQFHAVIRAAAEMQTSNDIEAAQKRESAYSQRLKSRSTVCQVGSWVGIFRATAVCMTIAYSPSLDLLQVVGCEHSLPDKAYYHRYRICLYHASLKQVSLEGKHMRFCQHCGRFQALTEFTDTQKSCVKSLERHKARQNQRYHKNKARAEGRATRGRRKKRAASRRSTESDSDSERSPADSEGESKNAQAPATVAATVGSESAAPSTSGQVAALFPRLNSNETNPEEATWFSSGPGVAGAQAAMPADWMPYIPDDEEDAYHSRLPPNVPAPSNPPPMPGYAPGIHPYGMGTSEGYSAEQLLAGTLEAALEMLNPTWAPPGYGTFDPTPSPITRVSFKLFNCAPEDLSAGLLEALQTMLADAQVSSMFD